MVIVGELSLASIDRKGYPDTSEDSIVNDTCCKSIPVVMTVLGNFTRRRDRAYINTMKSLAVKGRPGYTKPRPPTTPVPSPIDRHRTEREGPFEPVPISVETMKVVEVSVRKMNVESLPCSVSAIANALAGNRTLLQTHSTRNKELGNPMDFLLKQMRRVHIRRGKFKSDEDVTKRKYEIMRAFNELEKMPSSVGRKVSSWEECKEALSAVLRFPGDDELEERQEAAVEKETKVDIASKFLKEMDDVYRSEESENLHPYDSVWKKIITAPIPSKLGDSAQAAGAHKSALEKADNMFRLRLASVTAELEARAKSAALKEAEERMKAKELEEEARKRASSLMRPLSREERERVQQALYGRQPPTAILVRCDADSVQQASMSTLQPGQWVNDEVIHYFLLMLSKRDEEMCRNDPGRKRSHFFKSFFITKLLNEGHATLHGQYEYRNVKRWSKNVPGKDLFKLDKVFFPINQGNMHWLCACAFMTEKRIEVFDSMGSSGLAYLKCIFQYLQDDHKDKKGVPMPDVDKWELVPCQDDTPQQRNGYDCGVFTCMFIDFLSKDCPLVFTQEHVNQCRERIALSILNGKAIM